MRSADPAEQPLIDPNLYAERNDVEAMLAAMEVMVEVAQQKPLAQYISGPCMPAADRLEQDHRVEPERDHREGRPRRTFADGGARDQRDVVPGLVEAGADAATDPAGSQHHDAHPASLGSRNASGRSGVGPT